MTIDYRIEYSALHNRGEKIFSGLSVMPWKADIERLVFETRPARILDYGCGKGAQYKDDALNNRWPRNIDLVLYDIGVWKFRNKPQGVFQGIICTDVLEHVAEDDVSEVLREIFSYADNEKESFVFFSICCRLAKKSFSNGVNLHLTVRPPGWWMERIDALKPEGVRLLCKFTGDGRPDRKD